MTPSTGRPQPPRGSASLEYESAAGRWVLFAVILGSAMAFIDGTVVNLALPHISAELGADAADLQWVVTSYGVVLAALVLPGGSLGDRFGRRRIFLIGVAWFALASLLCAVAPTSGALIAARTLQGVGAALLTPGSLAVLQASFTERDRMRAIGAWSGLGGVASAIGPFLGGWIVDVASWRWVFLINVPLAAVVIVVALRHVPESSSSSVAGRVDVLGAALSALGLAGLSYGFIAWPARGIGDPVVFGALGIGTVALVAFVVAQSVLSNPLLPLRLFRSRSFTATNIVTVVVYAGLGGFLFFTTIALQVVVGYSALAAGVVTLPVTALLLVMSPRAGALATRFGPRIFMAIGPVVAALGMLLLARMTRGASYLIDVFPGVLLLGIGLGLVVAPLTATALASVDDADVGVASGFNNAVARTGGLLAIAVLPLAAGVGSSLTDPVTLQPAYRTAMLICAILLAVGAGIAALGVPASFAEVRSDAARSRPPDDPIGATQA